MALTTSSSGVYTIAASTSSTPSGSSPTVTTGKIIRSTQRQVHVVKFYQRHNELVSKFNVGLKSLLHQCISEPEFYGDLVYKFKKIRGMTDFSDQFGKIIMRYKRIGFYLNVMRQSACLVINPIAVDGFAAIFNCTPVDRASDSMMAPT